MNKLAVYGPERVKSCATGEKQQQTCEVLCQAVHYGSHLRVLSDVLFQSSSRLIIFGSSCSCQKSLGVHSATGIQAQVIALSSDPCGSSELLAAVPSQISQGQAGAVKQIQDKKPSKKEIREVTSQEIKK